MGIQRQINKLDELMDGAAHERFNYELDRVLRNVFDPNTSGKQKRQIQIVIDITANERRDAAEFKLDVKSKLAPPLPISQTVFLAMDDAGNVTATEITNQVPGQVNLEGEAVFPKILEFKNSTGTDDTK